jgi:hypothetical protein
MFGVCEISVVPIRCKPTDVAEIVSQLLFGETYHIIEKRRKWTKIECSFDGYIGWIDAKQTKIIEKENFDNLSTDCSYALELVDNAVTTNHFLPILMGSSLPNYDGVNFKMNGVRYHYSGQIIKPSEIKVSLELLFKIARRYLFAPYLWGGRSPFGIDCSGFTQNVFKMIGIHLKRDASQQVEQGKVVDFYVEARAGDLAFFENSKGKIVHVGLILPENQIIHASGKVRIDSFDRKGIYNHEISKHTHQLRIIKRFLSDDLY